MHVYNVTMMDGEVYQICADYEESAMHIAEEATGQMVLIVESV